MLTRRSEENTISIFGLAEVFQMDVGVLKHFSHPEQVVSTFLRNVGMNKAHHMALEAKRTSESE